MSPSVVSFQWFLKRGIFKRPTAKKGKRNKLFPSHISETEHCELVFKLKTSTLSFCARTETHRNYPCKNQD